MTGSVKETIVRCAEGASDRIQNAADYANTSGISQDELAALLAPVFDKITEVTGCEPAVQVAPATHESFLAAVAAADLKGLVPSVNGETRGGHKGMTLRDWFAGQALAGARAGHWAKDGLCETTQNELAEFSYIIADAMLAERAKGGDA